MALLAIAVKSIRRWTGKQAEENGERQESIPYAPAIALGVWLSLVPKG
jgi:hypothetical protein